jgi:hypothetical protein
VGAAAIGVAVDAVEAVADDEDGEADSAAADTGKSCSAAGCGHYSSHTAVLLLAIVARSSLLVVAVVVAAVADVDVEELRRIGVADTAAAAAAAAVAVAADVEDGVAGPSCIVLARPSVLL